MMVKPNKKLILASKSPRRHDLMRQAGFEFEIRTKDTDESFPDTIPLEQAAGYIAWLKAKAFEGEIDDGEILITADTVVFLDDTLLGKPKDRDEAVQMLTSLSGKCHTVITGVCLTSNQRQKSFSSTTEVTFYDLTPSEIEYYVDEFKPYDKAGAYGAQDWVGLVGVRSMEGSFYNVMGLPIDMLYRELIGF
jgi:septum formation protein